MGDTEDTTTPAGRYLQQRMTELGYRTKADLADTANVSRSTITRLFKNADYRPDVDVMRRLARGLQVEHDTLVAAIYGDEITAPAGDLHPLAAELGRMLAADSPVPATSKRALQILVDRVVDPSRREMRTTAGDGPPAEPALADLDRYDARTDLDPLAVQLSTALADPAVPPQVRAAVRDAVTRVLESATHLTALADAGGVEHVQEILNQAATVTVPSVGVALDLATLDGSDLHPDDRQAIRDGLRVLMQLLTAAAARTTYQRMIDGELEVRAGERRRDVGRSADVLDQIVS